MGKTQEKQKSKKSILYYIEILLIILIIIASIFAVSAWAKYLTSKNGNANAEVAKWHFEITNGTQTETRRN